MLSLLWRQSRGRLFGSGSPHSLGGKGPVGSVVALVLFIAAFGASLVVFVWMSVAIGVRLVLVSFVVSLSANHNDLLVSNKAMFPPSNPKDRRVTAAIRMTALRQALGQIWETFVLVKSAAAIDAVMPS